MTIAEPQPREAAKAAFAQHAWRDAYERFAEADRAGGLGPADLDSYGEAAWWCGQPSDALALRERAYKAYVDAGDRRAAAGVAIQLAGDNASKRSFTLASAWLGRAERGLEGATDSREYGHLLIAKARMALGTGDMTAALPYLRNALELGERHGDRDVQAMALVIQGQLRIGQGDVREGLAMVDEATMAAVSGELGLMTTGMVYCCTISACRDVGDVRRASDWTEAAHRWCDRQSVSGFPGVCRVHRAELTALRGALAKAEQEARVACDELIRWDIHEIAAAGFYEIGVIRTRMGDLPAAEEAFREAHAMGHSPEPGLSLVRLAEGKPAVALAALRRAHDEDPSRTGRAKLLPALVESAIAAADLATARAASEQLAEIAASFGTSSVQAAASETRGAVLLAEGETDAAQRELRRALDLWREVDAPYEASRTRMLIARAARAAGDDDTARLELGAAKATFERIGARRDARNAAAELGQDSAPTSDEAHVTRTFLFTDIVNSTSLIGVIGDDAWRDLIHWHDNSLRSCIAQHGGEEIRHQGDGLVVSFATPDAALECAVSIQRKLADHRKEHGFAPAVRIGVHRTDAIQRGLDFAGVGVHEAARVGALAREGEILVTRTTLDSSQREIATREPRTVELKGITKPIEVLSVVWR
ncbi:MAG TPA: adenylate/guanylate cyclase domain-containing protein [Candidatus Limnocylindria bacterium]|jgi:class 3 adenylate cyclase